MTSPASKQPVNLYDRLGAQAFVNLSTEFYQRVYRDDEDWFRSLFASSTSMAMAIRNQSEIFTQRMGGPPLFTKRLLAEAAARRNQVVGAKRSRLESGDSSTSDDSGSGSDNAEDINRVAKRPCAQRVGTRAAATPRVTPRVAARWLTHMTAAMDAVPEIDSDSKQRMLRYFQRASYASTRSRSQKTKDQVAHV